MFNLPPAWPGEHQQSAEPEISPWTNGEGPGQENTVSPVSRPAAGLEELSAHLQARALLAEFPDQVDGCLEGPRPSG